MTARENRARIRAENLAAGGETAARQRLLDATPPPERSEVAAKWDHARELESLDPNDPAIRDFVREDLEYGRLVEELTADSGGYRLDYIMLRTSLGLHLPAGVASVVAAARARAALDPPAEAEIAETAEKWVAERRAYLAKRYGVS